MSPPMSGELFYINFSKLENKKQMKDREGEGILRISRTG
jgi:hypothetical protein